MKVLIAVPVHNEAEALATVLPKLMAACAAMEYLAGVVVMSNGSTDDSAGVAQRMGARLVQQDVAGKPGAVKAAFEMAVHENYDHVVIFDGDGQHTIEGLNVLLSLLPKYDVVKGSRFHKDSAQLGTPVDREIVQRATQAVVRSYVPFDITDPPCGLVGMTTHVAHQLLDLLDWRVEWEIEMLFALAAASTPGSQIMLHEFPIPAVYRGLVGDKQRVKYDPARAEERVRERTGRHMAAILHFVVKYQF